MAATSTVWWRATCYPAGVKSIGVKMNDIFGITGELYDLSNGWTDEEFKSKYDAITDETVIPFLAEAGFAPVDDLENTEEWTDTAQTVLAWLCIKDQRIEKTLFAALHDHVRARAVQDDETGVAMVCTDCGEAFDDILIVKEHADKSDCGGNNYTPWYRNEAF
jgi:hypothetical protein